MRARDAVTPLVLVILAAGSAAYAYFVDRRKPSDAEVAERARDVFPTFRVADVKRIELQHGQESLVLEHTAIDHGTGTWAMTSPRRARVDPAEVDVLLRELELAARIREVTAGSATGLDAPRMRGIIASRTVDYRFELGKDAPMPEGAAYLRVDGEGTFVVAHSLKVQLLRGADVYRDPILAPLGVSDVARLEVRRGAGGGFALERHGATFRLTGKGLRASRAAVDRLFAAVADARADGFLEDDEADRDLGPSVASLSMASGEPRRAPLELRVGGPCPARPDDVVVVRLPGPPEPIGAGYRVSACAPKAIRDAVDTLPETLIDLSPFFAHADEVEQLLLDSPGAARARVEIARKGSGWHERSPDDRDLGGDETEAANALVVALVNAQAIDVRPSFPGGALAAHARVTVVRAGEGAREVVELGPPEADGVTLARRLDDGALLRLSSAVARRFEAQRLALRALAVWRAPFDPAAIVAIEDTCGGARQRLEHGEEGWSMRMPPGFGADPAAASDLSRALALAKAEAWIAERDDGTFGLGDRSSCTVTVTLAPHGAAGSPRSASVVFGAEGEDGVYARTSDDPAVFVVPASLRELASRPLIDRRRMRVDTRVLDRVTVLANGARVVLERAGAGLVRSAPSRADAFDHDALEEALDGLHAGAALHVGAARRDEGMDQPTLEIEAVALSDARAASPTRITVGASSRVDGADVYFARIGGVDATFAVPRQAVRAILDAM